MLFITILYIVEDCFHSHVAHGNFSNEKRVWFLDPITLWGILQIIIQNKIYISAIFSNCTTTDWERYVTTLFLDTLQDSSSLIIEWKPDLASTSVAPINIAIVHLCLQENKFRAVFMRSHGVFSFVILKRVYFYNWILSIIFSWAIVYTSILLCTMWDSIGT